MGTTDCSLSKIEFSGMRCLQTGIVRPTSLCVGQYFAEVKGIRPEDICLFLFHSAMRAVKPRPKFVATK